MAKPFEFQWQIPIPEALLQGEYFVRWEEVCLCFERNFMGRCGLRACLSVCLAYCVGWLHVARISSLVTVELIIWFTSGYYWLLRSINYYASLSVVVIALSHNYCSIRLRRRRRRCISCCLHILQSDALAAVDIDIDRINSYDINK